MLNFSLNPGHIAALTVINFMFSWAWYSPLLFGKPFMQALGIAPNREMSEEDKKRMPLLMANGLFSSLAVTVALQVLVLSVNAGDFLQGALVGLLCWLGFSLTGGLGTLWEKRSTTLVKINAGLALVSYAVFAGVLAAWH
jgi:hypothetical protein